MSKITDGERMVLLTNEQSYFNFLLTDNEKYVWATKIWEMNEVNDKTHLRQDMPIERVQLTFAKYQSRGWAVPSWAKGNFEVYWALFGQF